MSSSSAQSLPEESPPDAAAPASAESGPAPWLGYSSTLTEWSPEFHSWILLAENESKNAVDAPTTTSKPASPAPRRRRLPSPLAPASSPLASPGVLSDSLLKEGEAVADLAKSELLGEEHWPLPPSCGHPLASSAASDPEPACSCPGSPARRLGALAYPPAKRQKLPCSEEDDEEECDSPLAGWGRPLAVVAVLLASHAAVLLLGYALGRSSKLLSPPAVRNETYMTRRFSSGASGMHARLCQA